MLSKNKFLVKHFVINYKINYNYKIKVLVRELLDQIFVADPE